MPAYNVFTDPWQNNGDPGWLAILTVFHLLAVVGIPIYVVSLYLRHERQVRQRAARAVFAIHVEEALRTLQESQKDQETSEAEGRDLRRAA